MSDLEGFYLIKAAEQGYTKEVERLLNSGVDVNYRGGEYGHTALMSAITGGINGGPYKETVDLLIKRQADVNIQNFFSGQTALHLAIVENSLHGQDAYFAGKYNDKSKELEAKQKAESCVDIVGTLLANYANTSLTDKQGRTPLDLFKKGYKEYKSPEIGKLLEQYEKTTPKLQNDHKDFRAISPRPFEMTDSRNQPHKPHGQDLAL